MAKNVQKNEAKKRKLVEKEELDFGPDVVYLQNFTCKFVKENAKNFYFLIMVMGQADFRFYKAKMTALCQALAQAMFAADENCHDLEKDKDLFEKIIEEGNDESPFQSRVIANIYYKKIGIYYKVFAKSDETGDWVHTTRAIKFEYNTQEYDKFNNFVALKMMQMRKQQ